MLLVVAQVAKVQVGRDRLELAGLRALRASNVLAAVKRCHEKLHDMGAVRISSYLKLGTRVDREQSMQDKIDSVRAKV